MKQSVKLMFLFLVVLLINGCQKKTGAPDQFQNEAVISVDESTVDNNLTSETEMLPDFLSAFFQSNNYVLLDEPLDVNYRKIHFAVHYIKESPKIFDTAVGFEITDDFIVPYFYIKDFKFLNKDNTAFRDFSTGYNGIYGFNFEYSYPRQPSPYSPGLVIMTYFDNGEREADSFTISME